jgi:hypothetical protein
MNAEELIYLVKGVDDDEIACNRIMGDDEVGLYARSIRDYEVGLCKRSIRDDERDVCSRSLRDGEETFKNLFLTKLQNHLPDHPMYTKITKIQQMETLKVICLE